MSAVSNQPAPKPPTSPSMPLGETEGAELQAVAPQPAMPAPLLADTDPAELAELELAIAEKELVFSQKAYRWNRGRYSRSRRFIDIWSFVLKLLGSRWLDNKSWSYSGGPTPEKKAARRRRQAIWIRETMLDLGPTFIKVGQLFSTRADIFPLEYVEELSKLQDRVPAFSYQQVKEIIEADLGKPVHELYRTFDPIPLAAASLGQVHRAQLHSGEDVVVKVQRPALKSLFEIDLSILKGIK